MNEREKKIAKHCDGVLTSKQIAEICGDNHKYVQATMLKHDLPRRARGSSFGKMNGAYKHGRRFDRDGYVYVSAPIGHPYALVRKDRKSGKIFEHRLRMEESIGRYLLPSEIVDHIDGLRMHNSIENLRLFSSNAEHLRETITGQTPAWSAAGIEKQFLTSSQRSSAPRIHTYNSMKKSGDARLIQILLGLLSLGKASPYLLGSSHHLQKAGIFDLSHSNLRRELEALYRKYE